MYENLALKELPDSELEISAEIPLAEVEKYRKKVLKQMNEKAAIPGFRSGRIPEEVLIRHVGEPRVMEEVAEAALAEAFAAIVKDRELDPIGRPEATLTKLAPGNPIAFKLKLALFPRFELPDYKALAAAALHEHPLKPAEVSDAEVEETLKHFRLPPEAGSPAGGEPPLTDETVKKFGDFASVADFKEKLRGQLLQDKERRAREERRGALAEKIITATPIPLPAIIVQSEIEKMFAQFRGDIERMGMQLPGYLEKIKKTEDDLRNEWRPNAEKRAKLQFILRAIAKQENITALEADLERELVHLREHHSAKGGDVDLDRARAYLAELLTNEQVFKFLESQHPAAST